MANPFVQEELVQLSRLGVVQGLGEVVGEEAEAGSGRDDEEESNMLLLFSISPPCLMYIIGIQAMEPSRNFCQHKTLLTSPSWQRRERRRRRKDCFRKE